MRISFRADEEFARVHVPGAINSPDSSIQLHGELTVGTSPSCAKTGTQSAMRVFKNRACHHFEREDLLNSHGR